MSSSVVPVAAALMLALAFAALPAVQPYAKGAPEGSCGDMVPQHGVDPQNSASPYSISAKRAGDAYAVEIKGNRKSFKGFFVQARDDKGAARGAWKKTPGVTTVDCSGKGSASGATHSGPEPKDSITLSWEPKGTKGKITFQYTVAHNGGEFWVNQKSQPFNL